MDSLGDAVIAIGVFDGVHVGHRELLRQTVADALALGVSSVAVTFDRDPDQVVSPETAAPQLLSLADKLRFIAETGVQNVLVIPFTPRVAEMAPEAFLDSVLLTALHPLAVHVGQDFRFGSRATGDAGTLERAGLARGFRLAGHELVTADGLPVTSTRIRRLVAEGDIEAAARLLGRPPRVSGTVRRGRGEGASLGFATANVAPDPYAALPADGVYAGRALLASGEKWAAAVSVGTPPSFPEARDYLEAHLIDFGGDLYDLPITLEFLERLRDQTTFASVAALTAAIADDVAHVREAAGVRPLPDEAHDARSLTKVETSAWKLGPALLPDGSPVVTDPAALEAAERAMRGASPDDLSEYAQADWVELLGPTVISGLTGSAGWNGFQITIPLRAAGIPFLWQPYDPTEMPGFRPAYGAVDRPFSLEVPVQFLKLARETLDDSGIGGSPGLNRDAPKALHEGDEPWIDDPALLAHAEEAARSLPARPATPIDWDSWIPLLAEQPYDRRRLLGFQHTLESLGIPVKWDPFSPAETLLLKQGFFHKDLFTLAVPNDRLDDAQDALAAAMAAMDGEA